VAGIAEDPEKRPRLDDLIAACDRRRPSRWWLAVPAAIVLGGGAGLVQRSHDDRGGCRSADERLAQVWTPAIAATVRQAAVTAAPYAQVSVDHTLDQVS